jgi:hypothetical protein
MLKVITRTGRSVPLPAGNDLADEHYRYEIARL